MAIDDALNRGPRKNSFGDAAAAMSNPGTFLSQFGTMTSASKPCANAMASVESAMRSRVTSEYFMPVWPIAMPSHTAIAGKTIGVPPAIDRKSVV